MRILLATNHLANFGGSEIVVLEFAEYFQRIGHAIEIFANWHAPPMGTAIEERLKTRILSDPAGINVTEYDLAYFQHHVSGLFDYRITANSRSETAIVIGRLARRHFLESGGWLHDHVLADHVFANSDLTAEHLVAVGLKAPITTFYNAAPQDFFAAARPRQAPLRKILVISNNGDPSLKEASALLRHRFRVRHVGRSGEGQMRVTPECIRDADLIVSIGKTVQYGLASRTPVFVYDHFGGPGYLDEGSFDLAARFSFTGRCCERRLSGADLAREIVEGFEKGLAFANRIPHEALEKFRLPNHLDAMLGTTPRCNTQRALLIGQHPFLLQERMLARYVRDSTIAEGRRQLRANAPHRRLLRAIATRLERAGRRGHG